MKKFSVVLAVIYLVALLGALAYSSFSIDLIGSVKSGNIEKLKSQLEKDIDPIVLHKAMLFAIDYEKVDAVQILLDSIDDIDYEQTSGRLDALLSAAISAGNMDIINILIEKGVNINKVDNYNMTPLQIVVNKRNYSLAFKLIEKGADLSLGNFIFNGYGGEGQIDDKKDAEKMLRMAIENTDTDKINSIDSFFKMAVDLENFELMDILIKKYLGEDYLKLALKTAMIGNKSEMVDYIASKGVKITNEEIYNLAVAMLQDGNFDMLKKIAVKDGKIDDEKAVLMFTRAMLSGKTEAVKFLLENGFDVKVLPVTGDNIPIILAIRYCEPDIVKLLLEYNVPFEVETRDGKNAFEVLKEVKEKNVEWFDFGHKRDMDDIYDMLKEYRDKNNGNLL